VGRSQLGDQRLEYRWLLPAALEAPAPGPHRRSTRDWVVDSVFFVLGFGFTLVVTADLLRRDPTVFPQWRIDAPWLVWLDFVTSTISAVGLWLRRGRWLVPLAALTLVMSVYSVAGSVTGVIVLLSVAVHCRFWVLTVFVGLFLAAAPLFFLLRPERGASVGASMIWVAAITVIVALWGMVVRSRRQLVLSLRDRAERAETEQQLRIKQARSAERTRIAREMHDVLAHRISLLSLHAGALEICTDATTEEVALAAGIVRASAHQALEDLREVLSVLREEAPADGGPEQPQPTLGALSALAEESRSAGIKVRLDVDVEPTAVPDGMGRTAYRIVQEGLTNARKHAPGVAVRVAVGGAEGDGLTIDIRNPWPVGRPAMPIPGAGTGLIGLVERATLAGGRLTHGRTPENDFAVTAWLPWPASA
jgi:signal transduction histidine kinase